VKQSNQPVHFALRLCALALSAVLLAGCQSIDIGSAQLRIVDASRDSGALDLYQNSTAFAYNLGFGTLTSYVAMSPGTYTLAADKSGSRQTLVEASTHLVAGKQYTAIIGNGLANLQQTVLLDQSTPAPAGQIALRFVDQAPRAGAVDIYLVGSGGRLAATAPIATGLTFGAVEGYLNVPAGTYAIEVVPAGTVLANTTATLLTGPQVEYLSGDVRTVIILDQELPGGHIAGVSVVVADDAEAP
jgi:hypothetical protein